MLPVGTRRGTLAAMKDDILQVTCLCAAWCGTCRDYEAVVGQAAARFSSAARFRSIDIEDDAALVDDVDIDNFPTVLIARGERVLFFGPITPQPGTLFRLVEQALAGELTVTGVPAEADALARRLATD